MRLKEAKEVKDVKDVKERIPAAANVPSQIKQEKGVHYGSAWGQEGLT
jgi:hypothetical protein